MIAVAAILFSVHGAYASDRSNLKVSLAVKDSISISIDGRASGSDRIIQVDDPATGIVTFVVLD